MVMEWRSNSRSVPSLASGDDRPTVTARGEINRSRRRDLGRVGQPTRFLGLGNTGKPNNSAILHTGRAGGKSFWHLLEADARITHFCSTIACPCHGKWPKHHLTVKLYQPCHLQIGPMYHPLGKRRDINVDLNRGFCSVLSTGDRNRSAHKNPPPNPSAPRRHALNSPARFSHHDTESLYTPDTARQASIVNCVTTSAARSTPSEVDRDRRCVRGPLSYDRHRPDGQVESAEAREAFRPMCEM